MNPLRTLVSLIRTPLYRFRLRRMLSAHPAGEPLRVVVGAHRIFPTGWIPTERESLDLLDPRDWARSFRRHPIDAILAEHVWEHLTREQGLAAARLCHLHLRPGGYARIAVPDGLHPSPEYIDRGRVGGSGPAADDHKVLYDYRTLGDLFREAGFEVDLLEYYDEAGVFHFNEWDPADGMIRGSTRFHQHNPTRPYRYTSLILDARKPAPQPA